MKRGRGQHKRAHGRTGRGVVERAFQSAMENVKRSAVGAKQRKRGARGSMRGKSEEQQTVHRKGEERQSKKLVVEDFDDHDDEDEDFDEDDFDEMVGKSKAVKRVAAEPQNDSDADSDIIDDMDPILPSAKRQRGIAHEQQGDAQIQAVEDGDDEEGALYVDERMLREIKQDPEDPEDRVIRMLEKKLGMKKKKDKQRGGFFCRVCCSVMGGTK